MTVDNDQRVCLTPAVHFISSTSPWISRGFTVGNLIPINSTHEADSLTILWQTIHSNIFLPTSLTIEILVTSPCFCLNVIDIFFHL